MAITTVGKTDAAKGIAGVSFTPFNNANAYLGVGDSSTAFDVAQTDLQAATNKLRKAMDATYPTQTNNVLVYKATFGSTEANWEWLEVALFNAAAAGDMLRRKVVALGTKASGETWVLTSTITVG
jgi:hypothetical protein